MGTALGYIRRSASEESPVSEDLQRDTIARLAAARGDVVVEVYRDWGRSGGSEVRPAYLTMLSRLEANGITAVYAYDQDRLARNVWLFSGLLRLADLHGFAVVTPSGDLADDRNRDGAEYRSVGDGIELRKMKRRANAIAAKRRSRGDAMGQLPFGYSRAPRADESRTSTEPIRFKRDADRIGAVLDAYRAEGTYLGTARALSAAGVPSQRKGGWHATTVKGVILREAPELAANVRQGTRKQTRPRLLTGLLICPACGHALSPGRGFGQDVWYCGRGQRGEHPKPWSVTESRILGWVYEEASRLLPPLDRVAVAANVSPEDRAKAERMQRSIETLRADGASEEELAPLRARLSALTATAPVEVVDLPASFDPAWPVEVQAAVLRAMWTSVTLGPDLYPVAAVWTRPEWRGEAS